MNAFILYPLLFAILALVTLAGCSTMSTNAADVSGGIRTSLGRAGLKDVTVSQDRDKALIILEGNVASDAEKLQAATLATGHAGTQVVSNQIAVLPPSRESDAKMVILVVDEGIDSNLRAALIKENLAETVRHSVKNHVVTLTGDVDSQFKRERAALVAATVLNVYRVVNELQVKAQKATSSR
ncbi:MAG: BON domain-containing protein [Acidobacteriota bacterium]